jgi:Predicted ribosomal protein
MIKAWVKKKQGRIVSYQISGHAYSGEFGHDIVCSAVSVLGQTTSNGIEKMVDIPLVEVGEGYLYVELKEDLTPEEDQVAQILLKNFEFAMQDVALEYGQYIKFTEKN